jgi:Mlc titration factor MtfA (ptsG expression regulator)
MFSWLANRRRKRVLAEPFPAAWDAILDANVPVASRLDPPERARLRELVQIFVAEKHFEGCNGLALDDEIVVTIAGHASLLLLGRDHDLYRDVDSILVYPSTVIQPPRRPAFFELVRSPVAHGVTLHGEAMLHGPVILSWDAVMAAADPFATRNVVIHELAHKIDMADGSIDGTPPLPTKRDLEEWTAICARAYRELRVATDLGIATLIDPYGATNEAEFFAVATETFFLRPALLRTEHPELYALLAKFYRLTVSPA